MDKRQEILFEEMFKQYFRRLYVHALGYVKEEESAYAKQSCGLFTRMAGKIAAMTFMQYVNFINHRPIGQIKYSLI